MARTSPITPMKHFKNITLSKAQARKELRSSKALLDDPSKRELKETDDIFLSFCPS